MLTHGHQEGQGLYRFFTAPEVSGLHFQQSWQFILKWELFPGSSSAIWEETEPGRNENSFFFFFEGWLNSASQPHCLS